MIFSLMLPVLFGGVALFIDYSNHQRSRVNVQSALDASAIWYAQRGNQGEDDDESPNDPVLQNFFDLNLNPKYEIEYENLTGSWEDESLLVTVDIKTPSLFSFMDFNETVGTRVAWSDEFFEIALVIDTTGRSRFKGNKTAIADAVAAFLDTYQGTDTRIGVVPFSDSVNVGSDFQQLNMDVEKKAQYNGANIDKTANDGAHSLLFDALDENWGGCLEARPAPFDETDETPSGIDNDTFWVPYFHPADPDNAYLNLVGADLVGATDITSPTQAIWDASLYTESKYAPSATASPNAHCNSNRILDLTQSLSAVESHVNELIYEGQSVIPLGILWAWRLLSPSPPFDRGRPYSDPKVKKVVILITDGVNIISPSQYSTYGYLSEGRLGTTLRNEALAKLDEKTSRICNAARDDGVDIFTLGIATDELTKTGRDRMAALMKTCAGDQTNSLIVETPEELSSSLTSISNRLSGIRIVR